MADTARLGPWVRRFLLEYLIGERNLSVNTQRSYRDTLALLIPFAARQAHKKVDELTVLDVSEKCVAAFLVDLEEVRGCSTSTRNQRLAAIHALSHFVAIRSPEHIAWCQHNPRNPFQKVHQEAYYLPGKARDGRSARRTRSQDCSRSA